LGANFSLGRPLQPTGTYHYKQPMTVALLAERQRAGGPAGWDSAQRQRRAGPLSKSAVQMQPHHVSGVHSAPATPTTMMSRPSGTVRVTTNMIASFSHFSGVKRCAPTVQLLFNPIGLAARAFVVVVVVVVVIVTN